MYLIGILNTYIIQPPMEIGIDSFAANFDATTTHLNSQDALALLLERIEFADKMGLDVFGIGEHHR